MTAHRMFYHRTVHVFIIIILLIGILIPTIKNALATISACSASISPTQLNKQTDTDVTISINNTDSNTVNWIKIQVPNPSIYTLDNISLSGWTQSSNDGETAILTGGTISPSASLDVTVNVATEDTDPSSAWTVQVSDDAGSSTFNCTGSLGTAVVSGSSQAPTISSLTLSNITSSSLTISWTTDVQGTTVVDYGTTNSYGTTKSDGALSTSHSVSIDSLSANTTYHFNAKSTSSSSVTGESGDQTFTTAKAGLTSETVTITTNTTVTATPTPTPIPDRIPPAVSITTDLTKPFLKPPTITGKASDASGISKVQYSVDDGKNWNNVDEIPNLGAKFITFTFTPPPLDDDNYNVRIRATDDAPAKNVRTSEAYTLIIDRLPPQIGGNIISIGPQVLFPNLQGYLLTSTNTEQKITLSAVGGPTSITLLAHPPGASESAKTYKLTRNVDNGLWSDVLNFSSAGIYQLAVESIDGADNKTNRLLNKIAVLKPGLITRSEEKAGESFKNITITLYYFEEKYQIWRVWDAEAYGQKNPIKTNNEGEFSYLVPSGKYYFDIKGGGIVHTQSEIFTIDTPTVLNPTFTVKPLKVMLNLWFFKIYWPDFSTTTVPVKISVPNLPDDKNDLIGKLAPDMSLPTTDGNQFTLSSSRGAPLVLSFLSTWSPQASEQITAIDRLSGSNTKIVPVMLGSTISKITIFKKKGEYKTNFVVDIDSTAIEPYHINTIPTHYFLDRRGVIKKIVTGVLSDKELSDMLLEVQ